MYFVVHALDRLDATDLRARIRPEHLEYLAGFEVVIAGPLLADDGKMCGSLIVLDVKDRTEAEAFADGDPYAQSGLFAQVSIMAMKPVVGV